jgi:lipopolysaccharide transport system permease protein
VIYPMSVVPDRLRPFYVLNPMAGVVDSYRRVVLQAESPSALYLGTAAAVALAMLILTYGYFKRVEWQFADIV